jgi:putative hydrolase of the HAD superfamily
MRVRPRPQAALRRTSKAMAAGLRGAGERATTAGVRFRAVTFDAGGTLFDVAEPVGVTYARVAAAYGITVAPDVVQQGFRSAFAAALPLAFPGASPTRLAEHERAWWYTLVRTAFGTAARAGDFDACFDALFAHYARAEAWRVFPDVPEALAGLRARAIRTAVVSNFDGRLPGLLRDLGLTPLLDATVWSTRVGHAKPDPAPFDAALRALAVPAADAAHVGDGSADVEGARRAGLTPIAIVREPGGATPAGVATIRSLAELPAALDPAAQP